ncbi:MAG: AI-2E family transporter [Patescibacteria group bacterium]
MNRDIVISIKTVIFTLLLFLGIYVVYLVGPFLVLALISLILMLALEPAIKYLMNKHFLNKPVSRSLAVTITYSLFLLAVIFILATGLPPVLSQARKLIANISGALSGIPGFEQYSDISSSILSQIPQISDNALSAVFSFFSNVFAAITVIVLAVYMSLDWPNIKERFLQLFPSKIKKEVAAGIIEVESNIGSWIKGQLLLMVFVGSLSFIGLAAIGVDYPLALGLISGLLEIVPLIGPLISAVLAGVVGFSESPLQGSAVIGLFVLIQQIENNFLVPKIMQKVVGFSPLVILIAVLIGNDVFGFLGALLSIPVMLIGVVIVKRFLHYSDS